MNETDAVELVAYTAMHCVHSEGKDRPTIFDIVANLERAFTLIVVVMVVFLVIDIENVT
jgi:hypothetical protein